MLLNTASNTTNGSTSTYVVRAGEQGVGLTVGANAGVSQDAWGNALVTNGMGSLLDFFGSEGGNAVNLTASQISSTINLDQSNWASISFTNGNPSVTGNADNVTLSQSSTAGASTILADQDGVTTVANFLTGRDSIDLALSGSSFTTTDFTSNGASGTALLDATGHKGLVLMSPSAFHTGLQDTANGWVLHIT